MKTIQLRERLPILIFCLTFPFQQLFCEGITRAPSAGVDQTANYTWSGTHNFTSSVGIGNATPSTAFGIDYYTTGGGYKGIQIRNDATGNGGATLRFKNDASASVDLFYGSSSNTDNAGPYSVNWQVGRSSTFSWTTNSDPLMYLSDGGMTLFKVATVPRTPTNGVVLYTTMTSAGVDFFVKNSSGTVRRLPRYYYFENEIQEPIIWVGSATYSTSGSTATFNLTTDRTATGTAIFGTIRSVTCTAQKNNVSATAIDVPLVAIRLISSNLKQISVSVVEGTNLGALGNTILNEDDAVEVDCEVIGF